MGEVKALPTKDQAEFYRVELVATLRALAPTHVGDGKSASGFNPEERKRRANSGLPKGRMVKQHESLEKMTVHRLYRRASGRLVLPAGTLKGFFRAGIKDVAVRERLLGPEKVEEGGQQGGCVRPYDATYLNSAKKPVDARYWDGKLRTSISSGIRMDNARGVQDGESLFNYEVYPVGAKFEMKVEMDFVDQQDIDSLISGMRRWDGNLHNALGGRKRKSMGVLVLKSMSYRTIGMLDIRKQVESGYELDLKGMYSSSTDIATEESSCLRPDIKIGLTANQPVLVVDPSRSVAKETERNSDTSDTVHERPEISDHRTTINSNAKPCLTTSTQTGALRAMAERIYATALCTRGMQADQSVARAKSACAVLFGNTQQAGRLQWHESHWQGEETHKQVFIAICRFSGGVAEGKLYDAEAIPPQAEFRGGGFVIHEADHWLAWHQALVYLCLRELQDGYFWLGWGKSKGYGQLSFARGATAENIFDKLVEFTGSNTQNLPVKQALTAFSEHMDGAISEAQTSVWDDPKSTWKMVSTPMSETSTVADRHPNISETVQYNPYGFVPVQKIWECAPAPEDLKKTGVRHDVYLPNRFSGFIECDLTTITDTLVGNNHIKRNKRSTRVLRYQNDENPALPANSLRGMVSSVVEAISQSSLRVLNDALITGGGDRLNNPNRGRLRIENGSWIITPISGQGQDEVLSESVIDDFVSLFDTWKPESRSNSAWKKVHNELRTIAKIDLENKLGESDLPVHYEYQNSKIVRFSPDAKIWRNYKDKQVKTIGQSFGKVDQVLVPWGFPSRDRNQLTPAEVMLGVVEEDTGESNDTTKQFNLASRIRFTDAVFDKNCLIAEEVTLRILSSPKTNSAFYYYLNERGEMAANGRKMYLHHFADEVSSEQYATAAKDEDKHADQRIQCRPIKKNNSASFKVYFTNLDKDELLLLLTAIEPTDAFAHKIGLGKPLGLGSIRIDIASVQLRDLSASLENSENCYKSLPEEFTSPLHRGRLVHRDTLDKLINLGETAFSTGLVQYPLTKNQLWALNSSNSEIRLWAEKELFKWFVANNRQRESSRLQVDEKGLPNALPVLEFQQGNGLMLGTFRYQNTERHWRFFADGIHRDKRVLLNEGNPQRVANGWKKGDVVKAYAVVNGRFVVAVERVD